MTSFIITRVKFVLDLFYNACIEQSDEHLKEADILLFCHDANRNTIFGSKAYSPLIDSLRNEFELLGYKCQSIANVGSRLTGDKAYGHPISFNRKYFLAFIKENLFFKKMLEQNYLNKYFL